MRGKPGMCWKNIFEQSLKVYKLSNVIALDRDKLKKKTGSNSFAGRGNTLLSRNSLE